MVRIFLILLVLLSHATLAQDDKLLSVLKEELHREVTEFSKTELPPYFISYRVSDEANTHIQSSFGSLVQSQQARARFLFTSVRVGDYQFDNTHPMDDGDMGFDDYMGERGGAAQLPLDDAKEALQYYIWKATQSGYTQARDLFKQLKNKPAKSESVKIPDFSKTTAEKFYEQPLKTDWFNKSEWENKVRSYSVPFQGNVDLVSGDVDIQFVNERKYFVSSEGAEIVQNQRYVYLSVSASIRAKGGDIVPLHKTYFAFDPSGLPDDKTVVSDVEKLISKLVELQNAPMAEPYTGPAILDAQVAGVFFHEIFGHRVEGERLRSEHDSQTFKEKINTNVLNKTLSVTFDPTRKDFNGVPLNGFYLYDDEGVKAQRVAVVEKGILKTFLMSRTPLSPTGVSNGHGRADSNSKPVSRQSNLIVETVKPLTSQDLRKMLIQEAKKQGKPYGYYFKDVVGGFTTTDRFNPNAFNIFPTEVYRIYVDGRPDELVRGVDLIGTPLSMFAEITAAGDKAQIFEGFCGAESGSVPVTAISPSLFVRRIETQKKMQSDIESTLLKSPTVKD